MRQPPLPMSVFARPLAMRAIGALIVATALALPAAVSAQAPDKVYRIGFLTSGTRSASAGMIDHLRAGLRDLGWVEGRNISIDERYGEGQVEQLPKLADELVGRRVDLIVAATSASVSAVHKASGTIPIVMANVADPVRLGLVADVARPGGNVTGLAYSFGWDVWGKQLQLLKEAVPNIRRVAILSNPANPSHVHAVENIKTAARSLGLSLAMYEARRVGQFDGTLAAIAKSGADALLVVSDPLFGSHAAALGQLAIRHRLPTVHGARSNVLAGGLLFYGPDLPGQLRQAATYVDKILKGANPAELPVEQPTKFELIVNVRTAKALDLPLPHSLLVRADQVIE